MKQKLIYLTGICLIFMMGSGAYAQTFQDASLLISEGVSNHFIRAKEMDASGNLYILGQFLQEDRLDIDFDPGAGVVNAPLPAGDAPTGTFSIYLAKYNSSNELQWVRAAHGDGANDFLSASDLVILPNGNIYISGNVNGTARFSTGYTVTGLELFSYAKLRGFVHGYTSSGVAAASFATPVTDGANMEITALDADAFNNIYVTGQYMGSPNGLTAASVENAYLSKYNSTGAHISSIVVARSSELSSATDVYINGSNDVFVTGSFDETADFDPTSGTSSLTLAGTNAFFAKYSSALGYSFVRSSGMGTVTDRGSKIKAAGTGEVSYLINTYGTDEEAFVRIYTESTGSLSDEIQMGDDRSYTVSDYALTAAGDVYHIGRLDDSDISSNSGFYFGKTLNSGSQDYFIQVHQNYYYYTLDFIEYDGGVVTITGRQGLSNTSILDFDLSESGEEYFSPGMFRSEYVDDVSAPAIISTVPEDGATGVPVNLSEITISINEDLYYQEGHATTVLALMEEGNSTPVASYDLTNNTVRSVVTGGDPTRELTLFNLPQLSYSTNYYVQFSFTGNGPWADWVGLELPVFTSTTLNFTTESAPDVTAPSIVSRSPAHNTNPVDIGVGSLTFTCNELLTIDESASASYSIVYYADGSLYHTIAASDLSVDGYEVTIDNIPTLEPLTTFGIHLPTNGPITDLAGNAISSHYSNWRIVSGPTESVAPTLVSTMPEADSDEVPYDIGTLTMTFSEPIFERPSGGKTFYLRRLGSNVSVAEFTIGDNLTIDGNTVTMTGVPNLQAGLSYWVHSATLPFQDAAQNYWASWGNNDAMWRFTVRSGAEIISQTPAPGATGVSTSTDIVIEFDRDVEFTTSDAQFMLLYLNASTNRVIYANTPGVSIQDNVLTIELADLIANGSYGIWLRNGLQTTTGEPISQIYSADWEFTTGAANNNPTNITLSNQSIPGSNELGDVIGELSTTDADASDTHTYTLASGGVDNASFTLDGNQLKAAEIFDEGVKDSYSIRIKTLDSQNGSFEKDFTIAISNSDQEAPTVLSSTPADNATGVDINATFTVTLSEEVQLASGLRIAALYKDGSIWEEIKEGNAVLIHNSDQLSFSFSEFNNDADYETNYSIQLSNITDLAGNALVHQHADWSFTTEAEPDVTAPTVDTFSPADDAVDIAREVNLVVTFDEGIQLGTGSITLFNDGGVLVENYSASQNSDRISIYNKQLTIDPTEILEANKGYYLRFANNAIEDVSGNAFAGIADETTWNFTTLQVGQAPTNILLSATEFEEDIVAGSPIATLSAEDPDGTADYFELIYDAESGTAYDDFYISGTTLYAGYNGYDYLTKSSYDITVLVEDEHNNAYQKAFVLSVINPNPEPIVTINDATLKTYLLTLVDQNNGGNNDGEVQVSEAENYTGEIAHTVKSLSDDTGLEAFVNITSLNLANNQLTAFDPSVFTSLTSLNLKSNSISSLDLSSNTALTELIVSNQSMSSLNVAALTQLTTLEIAYLGLSSIDLSNNTALTRLEMSGNAMTTYDFSLLTSLEYLGIAYMSLNTIDLTNQSQLTHLIAAESGISSLDLTGLTNLEVVELYTNNLTAIDLSGNASLTSLYLDGNQLTSLDLSTCVGLTEAYLNDNQLTSLNLANGNNTAITDLDITGNADLLCVQVDDVSYAQTNWVTKDAHTTYSLICKSDQTITFDALSDKTYGDAAFDLSATASSGLTVAFSVVSGPASLDGNTLSITGVGEVVIAADQAGNESYNTASQVTQSFTVSKASQTITFDALSDKTYGDAAFDLSATASSGLTVAFSVVSGPASLEGNTLSITGVGEVVIAADQAGNESYNAALQVTQSFTVSKASQSITFDALSDMTYGDAAFDLSATASSGLTVAFSVVSGPASLDGNTLSITGVGEVVIAADQAGDDLYDAASQVTQSFTISKAEQMITIDAIADKVSTDADFSVVASTDSGLELTYEISGPATLNGTTVSLTGVSGIVTITVSQAGNEFYQAASSFVEFGVSEASKTSQTITFDALPNKTYGDAAFDLTATASSGLVVSFNVVSGPASLEGNTLSITGAGEVVIAANQAGDETFNPAPQVTQSFTVAKANQTISFSALADKTYGDAAFEVSATSSVGLSVSFSIISGPATIDGSIVTITGAGDVVIAADQSGSDLYNAAPQVTQSFTVAKANQTIAFSALADKVYGDADFELNATASSGLTVDFSIVSGPATLDGNLVTITGVGEVVIAADQSGSELYHAASQVTQSFTIDKQAQIITIDAIEDKLTTDADFALVATSNSGLELTFEITGPATLNGTTVSLTGESGTVTITASQAGDEFYSAASGVVSFSVNEASKTSQSITFAELTDKTYGDAAFNLSASASSGLEVSFSVVEGPISISGTMVTITGAGTATISAQQNGDETFNPAPVVTRSFEIAKSAQSITFTAIADKVFGDATFALEGNASSGLDISYSIVSGPANLSGNEVSLTGAGEVVIAANQIGNANYLAAAEVTQSFVVAKKDQVISISPIEDKVVTDAAFEIAASVDSGLELTYEISGPATLVGTTIELSGQAGLVTVTVSQAGNSNYNAASAQTSFGVTDPAKTSQSISFDAVSSLTFGDGPISLSATATSGLAVTYSVISGPVSISGSELTILGAGEAVIAADQSGDDTFNPATQIQQSITINKAEQTIILEAISDKLTTDDPFMVSATVGSGLPLSYAVSGPATVSTEGLITLDGTTGVVQVEVTQDGDENFLAASSQVSFAVTDPAKASQTITFDAVAELTFGDAPVVLAATASSGLDITFSVISGPVSISGSELTILGAGEAVIAANQAGDESFNAAPEVTQSFTIAKANQSIQVTAIEDKLATDGPFDVEATVDSGLELSFEISGPASIAGQTITLDGIVGTVEITVSQVGNENYEAASVTLSFEVTQVTAAVLSIELEAYPNPTDGLLQIKSGSEIQNVEVYDLQGALRFSQLSDARTLQIDLRSLARGSYILRVFSDGKYENRRLLIH